MAGIVLSMTSCRQPEAPVEPVPEILPILKIGLLPEQNIFEQKRRYAPLAKYLGEKVGVTIELKVLSRYGNVITNFVSNDLDGAFFGSFTGALAQMKLGIEPLARPELADGTSTYHGMVFVRTDSGIKNGKDMKGKRFAFVDKATTAGWLLPMHYFEDEGIVDYRLWLQGSYFAGSHEAAIFDVLDKKADVGAAKNTVFEAYAHRDKRLTEELTILATSPEVPENTLGVKPDIDASIKAGLLEALLEMDQDKEGAEILKKFGVAKFIRTTKEDYAPVYLFATEIGLDLAGYDYVND
jgi:phosphonate transport system substrate-binding protein